MGISAALGSSALLPAGLGFRNKLINGDFRVAQRGTSFVSGANNDDTYNLDRWTILSDGNDVVDITRATDAPTDGLYSIGLDVETANKKFGIIQFIEQQNITGIQNKTVWLSFKAKTTGSSISNVKAVVLSWTGTADTVTSDVVSAWGADGVTPTWATNWTAENTPANLNVTGSWADYRVEALVDTASVKNLAVFIWCDDTSTTVGDFLYITNVQLEQNYQPTPFEQRPIGVELQLCQRYYYRRYANDASLVTNASDNGYVQSANYARFGFIYPVTMRIAPTSIEYSGLIIGGWGVGSTYTLTTLTRSGSTADSATLLGYAAGGGMTAGVIRMLIGDTAAGASGYYLAVSAEL
jgi:hypothetical protein